MGITIISHRPNHHRFHRYIVGILYVGINHSQMGGLCFVIPTLPLFSMAHAGNQLHRRQGSCLRSKSFLCRGHDHCLVYQCWAVYVYQYEIYEIYMYTTVYVELHCRSVSIIIIHTHDLTGSKPQTDPKNNGFNHVEPHQPSPWDLPDLPCAAGPRMRRWFWMMRGSSRSTRCLRPPGSAPGRAFWRENPSKCRNYPLVSSK